MFYNPIMAKRKFSNIDPRFLNGSMLELKPLTWPQYANLYCRAKDRVCRMFLYENEYHCAHSRVHKKNLDLWYSRTPDYCDELKLPSWEVE